MHAGVWKEMAETQDVLKKKSSGVLKIREGVPQHVEHSEEGANGVRKNV